MEDEYDPKRGRWDLGLCYSTMSTQAIPYKNPEWIPYTEAEMIMNELNEEFPGLHGDDLVEAYRIKHKYEHKGMRY